MTTTNTAEQVRGVEEILPELEAATMAFNDLRREQAGITARLKDTAKADRETLTKAALSGTLKGAKMPKLEAVRARAAELPYLLWAAEIRMLQLQDEYAVAKGVELEAKVKDLYAVYEAAEESFNEARMIRDDARQEWAWCLDEQRDVRGDEKGRRGRLAQLEEEGPNV